MNGPVSVAEPVMVIVFEAQDAVIPAGSPDGVPIPVAFAVVKVIAVNGVFSHNVGAEEAAETVFERETVIVPVADTVPQPPVKGIS